MTAAGNRARWAAVVLACVAQFMVILDVSVVNVALPSIRHSLGFSGAGLQWVVNAYTLAFAGFLLLGGTWPTFSGAGASSSAGCCCSRPRRSLAASRRARAC